MKRKIDENGETEVTPQFQPVQQNFAMRGAQTSWQTWGNNNMRFRGGRNPWRGRGMQNNNHGYYRAQGRGGPSPYGYFDPNQQMFQQQASFFHNTKWNQIPPPPVIPYPPPQPTVVEGQEVASLTMPPMAVADYQNPPPQQMMQPPPPNIQQQQQLQQQQLQQQHHHQQQQQQHHHRQQQQQQQRQQQQQQQQQNQQQQPEEGFKKGKNRRRPMSQSYPTRPWNKEDAERALSEEAVHMKGLRNKSLIIRFPDPEVSKDMVKGFHPAIDKVHFQVPSGPRYCFVQLHETANTENTIKDLEEISFGSGRLVVEKKFQKDDEDLTPEAIDPYTLYIGNLPTNVSVASVKEQFATASRIDIGFAQKMKHTRYAFIRYNSVDDAIQAYRDSHNLVLESRSIIVRFRRQRGHLGLPGENGNQKPPPKPAKAKAKKDTKEKDKDKEEAKEKEKEKTAKKDSLKVKKEGTKEDEDDDDDDEVGNDDDDDDDDDEDEDDDDDDDDDDDEEDDDEDDDDDEDEDEEEDNQDDDDDPDDDGGPEDGDDDDDDDDDDEDNEDNADDIFQQIDSQIGDLNGVNLNFNF